MKDDGKDKVLHKLLADLSALKEDYEKDVSTGNQDKQETLRKLVFLSLSKVTDFLYAEMGWEELDSELSVLNRTIRTQILPPTPTDDPIAYRAFQQANEALFHLRPGNKGYRDAATEYWLAVATCLRRATVEFGVAAGDQNRPVPCVLVPDMVLEQAIHAVEGSISKNLPISLKTVTRRGGTSGDHPLAKDSQRFAVAYIKACKEDMINDPDPEGTISNFFDVSGDTLDKWKQKFSNDPAVHFELLSKLPRYSQGKAPFDKWEQAVMKDKALQYKKYGRPSRRSS